MKTELEATFLNIDKSLLREKLKQKGAELAKPEFLQKRTVFRFPRGHEIENGWVRVRDEGDKVTMSVKVIQGKTIENQKESCIVVDNYSESVEFLKTIGCTEKSYQETKRELWILNGCEVTIDEWPFLEPFTEIEGSSEDAIREVSELLEFDYSTAFFGAAGSLIAEKYNISEDRVNNHTPLIRFDMENPFL
jgi:adenylate cyclase, class 2